MGDCEESEDAASSVGDEERVRRLFQACDGDGDGFIDNQDLLNICRELNLEESVEALMRELGADDHGRISYREFLRRRVALRPEIDAIKAVQPPQPEYLPTSSENSNSLGEKLSWEFDSGARDLSPEPTQQPASGNLLELANKLHVAALASLKAEILDLTNRLEVATQERDHLEKLSHKADVERRRLEQRLRDDAELHEEQLTELHSVIAELTRKHAHQRSLVIQEEPSEGDVEVEEVADLDAADDDDASDVSSDSPEPDAEPNIQEELPDTQQQLIDCRAENVLLQQRLDRALHDLEVISHLNTSKSRANCSASDCCQQCNSPIRIAHARVSSPACLLDRTSPSLVEPRASRQSHTGAGSPVRCDRLPLPPAPDRTTVSSPGRSAERPVSPRAERTQTRMAERVRLRRAANSDISALGAQVLESLTGHTQTGDSDAALRAALDHARADNNVMIITLDETRDQLERLSLLLGQHESNSIALSQAVHTADAALQVAETMFSLMIPAPQQDDRCNRLRARLAALKAQREEIVTTVIKLESHHLDPLPVAPPPTAHHPRKLDLETAVLMQELMRMREERVEMKARLQRLEKDRASHTAQLHTALQLARSQQGDGSSAVVFALERLTGATAPLTSSATGLPADASVGLAATLDRCKRKYQGRLRRLEAQMAALVARHADQVRVLRERIATLDDRGVTAPPLQETNI